MSGTVRRPVRRGNPVVLTRGDGTFVRGTTALAARGGGEESAFRLTGPRSVATMGSRGVEQRQLVGLITRRSAVRIRPPQPMPAPEPPVRPPGVLLCPRAVGPLFVRNGERARCRAKPPPQLVRR